MTDLRQAAQRLVDVIEREGASPLDWPEYDALRAALEQQAEPVAELQQVGPVEDMMLRRAALRSAKIVFAGRFVTKQAEPVSQAVIAGALFDFMGWLTTRDERLVLSGADEAGPAVEAITAFSKMRGLSLDDAKVQDWQNYTTQQQAEPVAHVLFRQDDDGLEPIMFYPPKTAPDPRTLKDRFVLKDVWLSPPPQRQWVGLTDDEILSTDPWEILRADPWMGTSDSNINPYQILLKVRTLEAKLKERNA